MNILRSDIERICNYTESNKPSLPKGNIYYIDTLTSQDEWYINQQKMINRQKAINEVLDEKDESLDSEWSPFNGDITDGVVAPRMMSLSVSSSNFIDYKSLKSEIFKYLDSLTNLPMKTWSGSLNVQNHNDPNLSSIENIDATIRRIITKITFCSNLIAMNGRMGPANTIIVGMDIFNLMSSNLLSTYITRINNDLMISGMYVITSSEIKPNKCIVLRSSNQLGPGLNILKHDDGRYFMKETPNYEKMISWFELI